MSTAIAKANPLQPLEIPRPSFKLVEAIDLLERQSRFSDRAHGTTVYETFVDRLPSPDVIAEAKRLLPIFEQLSQPPAPELVRAWLKPLAAAVGNPPSRTDFEARVAAFIMVAADLPTGAFNVETLRAAMGKFTFWPSVAELREVLIEDGNRFWGPLSDLQKILGARLMEERDETFRVWREKRAAEGATRLFFPSERDKPAVPYGVSNGF